MAGALVEATHQVEAAIDDPPCEIASERADDHGCYLGPAGVDHAQCVGRDDDHDQAEQNLGNPVDRVEHAPDSWLPLLCHRSAICPQMQLALSSKARWVGSGHAICCR